MFDCFLRNIGLYINRSNVDEKTADKAELELCSIEQVFGNTFPWTEKAKNVADEQRHIDFLKGVSSKPETMMDIFHGIEKHHLDSDMEMKKRIEESDQIRKEGNELFVKGEYDKALHQCYLKAIKLTPNDARLFINSGLCSLKLADSSHNVKIRTIHAHNAFVYGFAAFLIQKYELKPLYILYQAYDLLGYSAAKVKVMEKAKEYSYGNEYETFNVPRQLKNKPQRLDAADLRTSANSLLTESDVMEQLFHMCHVSFIVENEFDPSLSQGSPEKTLLKMNFLEKFMKMPVFVKLFANHSLYKDLSFEDSIFHGSSICKEG